MCEQGEVASPICSATFAFPLIVSPQFAFASLLKFLCSILPFLFDPSCAECRKPHCQPQPEAMEPVSIIGLVASLLQLIQFSTTILSKAKEVHTSKRAAAKDNVVIEDIVLHLKESMSRINSFPISNSTQVTDLRTQCSEIADDILQALEDIRVKGPSSRWKSLRKAVKAVRSKEKNRGVDVETSVYA